MLSVIIPVFNERDTIERVIDKVRGCGMKTEIIIVDDCSTDGTRELLRAMNCIIKYNFFVKD